MADNLFEAKVDLELPVQVFADAYGNISRGLKRIYTKENGDVVFVLTDGTEHIVGNVVGQQGPTGPASTVPGPTGPTGATGKQGAPGKDGENGAPGIYYGSTQPSGPDFPVWIDPSGAAGIPLSITGPTGATGSPGAKGDKGEPGAKGDKGDKGSPGAKGDKGDTGATPNLSIGTVTTLEAGQNATASMGGTAESPVLNLGIPRGAKGEPGQGGGVDIVTSVSSSSTDAQVPSAKCLYDLVGNVTAQIDAM
nr:MAG TPA: nucleoid-associated protein [Caudoviricetes sp.]